MKDEEREFGRAIVEYWEVTNLIYAMNKQLQLARTTQDVLKVCANFSTSSADADGSLVCILRGQPEGEPLFAGDPKSHMQGQEHLLKPDHPFYQRVLIEGGRWQERDLSAAQRHDLGLQKIGASSVLAVPIKRGQGQNLGGILVWKTQDKSRFDSKETGRLQLCASQTGLVIENLNLHLVEEKMAAWETLSRGMAYEIHNPITLLGIWLEEIKRDAESQCGPEYARHVEERFLSKMKRVLKEADAATREFLFDFDPNAASNRSMIETGKLILDSLADIPDWENKVDFHSAEIRVFVNRRRLKTALRDIAQRSIIGLPEKEKLRIEVIKSDQKCLAAQIVFTFPELPSEALGSGGSIFLYKEDELIKGLIRLDKGFFQEYPYADRHVIAVSLPGL